MVKNVHQVMAAIFFVAGAFGSVQNSWCAATQSFPQAQEEEHPEWDMCDAPSAGSQQNTELPLSAPPGVSSAPVVPPSGTDVRRSEDGHMLQRRGNDSDSEEDAGYDADAERAQRRARIESLKYAGCASWCRVPVSVAFRAIVRVWREAAAEVDDE